MTALSPTNEATGPVQIAPAVDTVHGPAVPPAWVRRVVLLLALTFAALAGASGAWVLAAVAVALVAAPAAVTAVLDRIDARCDVMVDEALEDADA